MQLLEDFFNDIDDINVKDETSKPEIQQRKTEEDFSAKFIISYKYTKELLQTLDYKTDLIVFKRICYIFTKTDFTSDDFVVDAVLWTMDKNDWGKQSYQIEDTTENEKQLITTLKKIHKDKAPSIEITYRIYCDILKTSYKTYTYNLIKLSTTLATILSCYNINKITFAPIYGTSTNPYFDLTNERNPYSSNFPMSYKILFGEEPDTSTITRQYKEGGGQHILKYMLNLEQR